jgi:hypothetical protein
LSSKTLTFAANQISGNSVDGGVISNFASTGIDDNASATAVTIASDGNVGIGGAAATASGYSKYLHVQATSTGSSLHLTDGTSGHGAGDGFELLSYNGTAYVIQRENNPLLFYTNDTPRMRIDSSGNVGIGMSPTGVSGLGANKFLELGGSTAPALVFRPTTSTCEQTVLGAPDGLIVSATGAASNANNKIRFFTTDVNSSNVPQERMRIDSSGGVGINTNTNIEYMLDVGRDDLAYTSGKTMRINSIGDTIFSLSRQGTSLMSMRNDATGYTCISSNNSSKLMLGFGTGDAGAINNHLYFTSGETIVNDLGQDRDFRVESDTNTHALFVDANGGFGGDILFGVSSRTGMYNGTGANGVAIESLGDQGTALVVQSSTNSCMYLSNPSGNTNDNFIVFSDAGGTVGSISGTSTGTTYNTTSDRRLKDNIEPIADATDKLMNMNPVTHTWIADPEAPQVHGFIAQEMQEVVPEAVSGDAESDEMMSMDYGRITPVIVAALQDALNEIKKLKTRIDELESK